MLLRQTARLIVIDEQQRMLLFRVQDTRPIHDAYPTMVVYWLTPGGGVEPNETFEQAALRELWEETGISVEAVGPQVWAYERLIHGDIGDIFLKERFFMVCVPNSQVTLANMSLYERETHQAFHWWTRQELLKSKEFFLPPNIAQVVEPLLNGDIPSTPIELTTRPISIEL